MRKALKFHCWAKHSEKYIKFLLATTKPFNLLKNNNDERLSATTTSSVSDNNDNKQNFNLKHQVNIFDLFIPKDNVTVDLCTPNEKNVTVDLRTSKEKLIPKENVNPVNSRFNLQTSQKRFFDDTCENFDRKKQKLVASSPIPKQQSLKQVAAELLEKSFGKKNDSSVLSPAAKIIRDKYLVKNLQGKPPSAIGSVNFFFLFTFFGR